uniref:Uncharacterized protein n=3 Tax=Aegilops tauschii TaxID=37682 RepID=A0A453L3G5_AEGTS
MWEDALKEDGQCWKIFCAPLKTVRKGSMMLVTTRSQKVADGVRTMKPFKLNGLKDNVFWNFFKLCMFGSESSNNNPELEHIGRSILPKLKGSLLGAKTLGRLLRMNLDTRHWNNVLESELWELSQEETDILPALRLSYLYLPLYLKRCYSFCAVYPKDHEFEKDTLAGIWVAEGFVEPQGDIPIQDIACQYFEDLVSRSFFQKVRGTYVIHDLLHDMVQLVAKHDCFILGKKSDFHKIPQIVRHLSILSKNEIDCSKLRSLCKHTKLRTLLCTTSSGNNIAASVMAHWCNELARLRMIFYACIDGIPDSIGNLKHLRYLQISRAACPPKRFLPPTFSSLYNLQILRVREIELESLSADFSNLITFRGFELCGFQYYSKYQLNYGDGTEAELKNKSYLHGLEVRWSSSRLGQRNYEKAEVLNVVQLPTSSRSLLLLDYPGVSTKLVAATTIANINII